MGRIMKYAGFVLAAVILSFWAAGCNLNDDIDMRGVVDDLTTEDPVWEIDEKITAETPSIEDFFGYSVDVSGDWVAVGAYGENTNQGAVYIFREESGHWVQKQRLYDSTPTDNDLFGYSVSISGEWLIIGIKNDDDYGTNAGNAWIYKRNTSNVWVFHKELGTGGLAVGDRFGAAVNISDNYAIVGAVGYVSYRGTAFVYEKDTGGSENWGQQGTRITPATPGDGDQFGWSVGISGSYAIVGAPFAESGGPTNVGFAYIFQKRDLNQWGDSNNHENWFLEADSPSLDDYFGFSVALDNGKALTGAPGSTGFVNLYTFNGTDWLKTNIAFNGRTASDKIGGSVNIFGDYFIIGAYKDSASAVNAGAAYIFEKIDSSWQQHNKFTPSDLSSNDYFGRSVAIDKDYAIIGATINEDTYERSGRAYIYYKKN